MRISLLFFILQGFENWSKVVVSQWHSVVPKVTIGLALKGLTESCLDY
jgi:hypothetical protein